MAGWNRTSSLALVAVLVGAPARAEPELLAPSFDFFDIWNLGGTRPPSAELWQRHSESGIWTVEHLLGGVPRLPDWGTFAAFALHSAEPPTAPPPDPILPALRNDLGRLVARREMHIDRFQAQSKIELPDPEYLRWNPASARDWKAEQELKFPIPAADSFFLFGSLDGNGDTEDNQSMTMISKAGLGWKWSPLPGSEVQFRGGRVVTYSDPYSPSHYVERSQVMVEFLAKVPVIGSLQLQYKGSAVPALVPTDRDQLKQDLKLALPLGSGGEFHLGAKYRWEYTPTPSPWLERASLYLGIELKH